MAGGKVVLSEGTLTVSTRPNVDKANTILQGQGPSTIVKLAASSSQPMVIRVAADDVTIRDMTIDGTRATASAGMGIWRVSGLRFRALDLVVKSTYQAGIHVPESSLADVYCEIAGCYLVDCGTHGINIEKCRGAHVHDNNLEDYGARTAVSVGIQVTGSEQIDVDGNIVIGDASLEAGNFPIIVKATSKDVTVSHNTVIDSDDDGINTTGSISITVANNIIVNSQGPAISTSNCTDISIVANTVRISQGNGIAVDAQDGAVSDVTIMGNLCVSGAKNGIIVTGTNAIDRVLIQGNVCRDNAQSGFFGIQTTGDGVVAASIRVYDNILNGNDTPTSLKADTKVRGNEGYNAAGSPGEIISISKTIDHADLTDGGDATARTDFDDAIPAGSIIKAVKVDITEVWNSDVTSTLTLMIGYVGDLDAFSLTADPGDDIHNTSTDIYWGESDCQAHRVSAAKTPRMTFTEDSDGTSIISGANATGTLTATITYMKA